MSMGKRKRHNQSEMWVPATELAKAPGHPFYQRLNRVLDKHGFDDFVEAECSAFYAPSRIASSLQPKVLRVRL